MDTTQKSSRLLGLLEGMENGLAFAAFLISFILMALVSLNIILRYVFSSPLSGTLEMTELLMVPMVFMPLAFAQKSGGHIRADILYIRIPYPYKKPLDIVINVIGFLVCVLFVWQTSKDAFAAYQIRDITAGHVRIITWPFRVTIPIGFLALAIRFFYQLVSHVRPGAPNTPTTQQVSRE